MVENSETLTDLADSASVDEPVAGPRYCAVPMTPPRELPAGLSAARTRAIITTRHRWANGTVLHYYFYNDDEDGEDVFFSSGKKEWRTWVGAEEQREVVRAAFRVWKELGIGLEFTEVKTRDEAEVRIGFMQGDGSWSYVGTEVLEYGPAKRTMNLGWDLTAADGLDTAIHEIGHTLGLNHEHQNPNAGIVWNEEAVYDALAQPPNRWSRDKTHFNIIRKIPADTVQGTSWDPESVMHYPFAAGLIERPARYAGGLRPRGGLSDRDRAWIRSYYPPHDPAAYGDLVPGRSEQLTIREGEQQNFKIRPEATRYYNIRTFGSCDSMLALFAERAGEPRYMTADDDSGDDRNASLRVKLTKGESYILRVQLRYTDLTSPPGVLMW